MTAWFRRDADGSYAEAVIDGDDLVITRYDAKGSEVASERVQVERPDPTEQDARVLLARLDAEQRIAAIADKVTPEHAAILAPLLPPITDEDVKAGALRVVDGVVYEAVADHTATKEPDPELWRKWREEAKGDETIDPKGEVVAEVVKGR